MSDFPLIVKRDHPKRAYREGRWLTVARAVPGTSTRTGPAAQALAQALAHGRPKVQGSTVVFRKPVDHHRHLETVVGIEQRYGVLFNKRFGQSFFGVPGRDPRAKEAEDLTFQKGPDKWEFSIEPADTGVGLQKVELKASKNGGAFEHVGYFTSDYMARRHIAQAMGGGESMTGNRRDLSGAREALRNEIKAEVRRRRAQNRVSKRTFVGRSLRSAMDASGPGDMVIVRPGTYYGESFREAVDLHWTGDGVAHIGTPRGVWTGPGNPHYTIQPSGMVRGRGYDVLFFKGNSSMGEKIGNFQSVEQAKAAAERHARTNIRESFREAGPRPTASPEEGDGINKSKGHLFFHGGYEWFLSPQGNILRATQGKAMDHQTGYRKGGREVMPLRLLYPELLKQYGVPEQVWSKTIRFT